MKSLKSIITKKDRATAIDLLKKAKVELRDAAWMQYVCIHLTNAANNNRDCRVAGLLRSTIMKRIAPHGTVTSWLSDEAGIHPHDLSLKKTKQYRLAWIDSMIAELQ